MNRKSINEQQIIYSLEGVGVIGVIEKYLFKYMILFKLVITPSITPFWRNWRNLLRQLRQIGVIGWRNRFLS